MKTFILLYSLLFSSIILEEKGKIEIAAMKSVELTYPEFATYDVNLSNSSGTPVDVSVIDPISNKQVKGFGLGPFGNATLSVDQKHVLRLQNKSKRSTYISIDFVAKTPDNYNPENASVVSFTLHNSSLKSIPLIIPNVMNPNLSPMSNSGVSLKMGQKIYYKKGLEKVVILTVDESIKPGDKIDVAKLIGDLKKN